MLYEVVDGKVFVFTLEDWRLFNKFIMEISFFDLFLNIVLIVQFLLGVFLVFLEILEEI